MVKAFVLKVIIAALHQMTKKAFPFHPQGRNFRDAITSKATCPNWPSSDVVQGLLAWKQGQMWYCKKPWPTRWPTTTVLSENNFAKWNRIWKSMALQMEFKFWDWNVKRSVVTDQNPIYLALLPLENVNDAINLIAQILSKSFSE